MSQQFLIPTYARQPVAFVRGEGVWLYDENDHKYMDAISGIGVCNLGHCHPAVTRTLAEQAGQLMHTSNLYRIPAQESLAQRLCELSGMENVFFSNSGAEANEAAIKIARLYGSRKQIARPTVIVMEGSFHGRTMGAASLTTSNNKVRTGWAPLMAGVSVAPFPHSYRYGWDEDTTVDFCLKELDHLMITECNPKDTAAMIIEPVQGEYGYYPAPKRFMEGLQARCKEHGILLIVDEIQAGYGRTGKFWSHEHSGVSGDILITAKGLASGYPLSAIAASKELMSHGYPGSQGGTYGANVVACAAALATLDVIEDEQLVARAEKLGAELRSHLEGLKTEHDCIDEIRGAGLMLGVEMVSAPNKPDGDRAARILKHCEQNGMLMLRCGSHGQVVRWLPPLTVTEAEMEQAVNLFEAALKET